MLFICGKIRSSCSFNGAAHTFLSFIPRQTVSFNRPVALQTGGSAVQWIHTTLSGFSTSIRSFAPVSVFMPLVCGVYALAVLTGIIHV
jgi:hypothetical protein